MEISLKKQEMIKSIIEELISGSDTAHTSYKNFVSFTGKVKSCIRKLEEVKTEIHTERIMSQIPDLPGI